MKQQKQFEQNKFYKFVNADEYSTICFWRTPETKKAGNLKHDVIAVDFNSVLYCIETNIKPKSNQYTMAKFLSQKGMVYTRNDNVEWFQLMDTRKIVNH